LVVVPVIVLVVIPVFVVEVLIVAGLVILVVVHPAFGLDGLFQVELVPGVEVELLDFAVQPLHADDRIVGIDRDDLEGLLALEVFVPLARGRVEIAAHYSFLARHPGADGRSQSTIRAAPDGRQPVRRPWPATPSSRMPPSSASGPPPLAFLPRPAA